MLSVLWVLSDQWAQVSVWRSLVFDGASLGHEAAPLGKGGQAEQFVGGPIDEVALGIEVIVDVGMDGAFSPMRTCLSLAEAVLCVRGSGCEQLLVGQAG